MATRKIIDIEQYGEKVWPKGHAKATFMSNGATVEDVITTLQGGSKGADIYVWNCSEAGTVTEEELQRLQECDILRIPIMGIEVDAIRGYQPNFVIYASLTAGGTISTAIEFNGMNYTASTLITNIPTEETITEWGFTKNTGTYSKPSTGIPKSDLAASVQAALVDAETFRGKYTKPDTGIPKSDLETSVQTSLDRANSALQPGDVESNTYIANFSYTDLHNAIQEKLDVHAANIAHLSSAMQSNKIILVREDLSNDYSGFYVLNGYIEDLVYFSVTNANGDTIVCDGVDKYAQDLAWQSLREDIMDNKQDKLVSGENIKTINGTSILGSGDIVISGGGDSSSGVSGAYSEVNHGTSDTTFTITPNTFHVWDEVANLTLTLGSETSGVANEFLFQFTSGATAMTLSLPSDLKWTEELIIEPNMIYQVSILKGLASVLKFSNKPKTKQCILDRGYDTIIIEFENGMTWNDWVNSSYNIHSFYISNEKVWVSGMSIVSGVTPSDVMEEKDYTYLIQD